jgi:hypothetical protein
MIETLEPLENLYFNWLCAKVVDVRKTLPSQTYWELLKLLHTTEFVWIVSRDDNRIADGKQLREEFLLYGYIPDDPDWRLYPGCSVLEMLIAYARRTEFLADYTGLSVQDWFWEFLHNLGLDMCDDGSDFDPQGVADILDVFIWRTYPENGVGGLFPLKHPKQDQRKIEIWYQFFDYLRDQGRSIVS